MQNKSRWAGQYVGRVIIAPPGFVTDFASAPRITIAYWLTGDTAHPAAVVHSTGEFHREKADAILLEAMERRWRAGMAPLSDVLGSASVRRDALRADLWEKHGSITH